MIPGTESERPVDGRGLAFPIAATLLAVILGGWSIASLSPTIDEWAFIHHGIRFWAGTDDHWMVDFGTLPLFSWIQNAPGAFYLHWMRGGIPSGPSPNFGTDLPLGDQLALLRLARWTNLVLAGFGTIWGVWLLAARSFGRNAAGIAALACAIEPNLLGGYVLATADGIIVPFALLTVIAYERYLRQPTGRGLIVTAIAFGLGTALKVSMLPTGLLLIGAWFLTDLVRRTADRSAHAGRITRMLRAAVRFCAVQLPVIISVGLLMSWAANGFLMGPMLNPSSPNQVALKVFRLIGETGPDAAARLTALQSLQIPAPLSVLRNQIAHSRGGHPTTFLGHVGTHGPWYYYPYVFAMKTHVILLVAAALSLFHREVRRSPLLLASMLIVVLSCTTKIHMGPRYFLTLYAFLAVMAGVGLSTLFEACAAGAVRLSAAAITAAAALGLTLASMPELLTHTNPLWGGDAVGYRYADANYDWGQGLYRAFRAADRAELKPICFVPSCDPHYGIAREREIVPRGDVAEMLGRFRGRFVAVAVRLLYHDPSVDSAEAPLYRALVDLGPSGRLTTTYFYFDLRDSHRFETLVRNVDRRSATLQTAQATSPESHQTGAGRPAATSHE